MAVRELPEVQSAVAVRHRDEVVELDESEQILQLIELSQAINRVELLEGEWPAAADEVMVERALLTNNNLAIGDTVTTVDGPTYKIVGVVESPLFLDRLLGLLHRF